MDGSYSFIGLTPALYTVRVVNSTVTSTRVGSDGSELAIQTYRIDGDGEAVGTGADKVGGEQPIDIDAPANGGSDTLATLQAPAGQYTQSIVTVDATAGDVTKVNFGFNFDTIVNTNDAGQGSLRQFLLNANLLTDNASLDQDGLTAGAETSIFMIPGTGDALGRPVDPNHDLSGNGEYTITPLSELPIVTDSIVLDASTQPGFAGSPIIELTGGLIPGSGIRVSAAGATIRSFVINDWSVMGVDILGAGGCLVEGNYIGTDVQGLVARGTDAAIRINANGNIIGGSPVARNILSGNNQGVVLTGAAANNVIQSNYIGVGADGTTPIPNLIFGIDNGLGASGTLIGGTTADLANIIANNSIAGVIVFQGTGTSILRNSIYANTGLGINLDENGDILDFDGVTVNDVGDVDTGANDLLNYPVFTSITEFGGNLTADFDLDAPAGDYRIEFFTNPSGADPSGNGEGEIYQSAVTVTHTGSGLESFSHSFVGSVSDIIAATATEESAGPVYGSTSEFSAAFTAVAASGVSGVVFEDVNYGGGGGRGLATANADAPAFTIERGSVTVELYDNAGTYLSNTTTAADGSYRLYWPGTGVVFRACGQQHGDVCPGGFRR